MEQDSISHWLSIDAGEGFVASWVSGSPPQYPIMIFEEDYCPFAISGGSPTVPICFPLEF